MDDVRHHTHQHSSAGTRDGPTGGGGGEVYGKGREGEQVQERLQPALGGELLDVVVSGVVTEDGIQEVYLKVRERVEERQVEKGEEEERRGGR